MNSLQITERHHKNITILDLAGKIRLDEGNDELRTALRLLIGNGAKNILLNLADVSHIDSSGLGELVAGYVALKKNTGEAGELKLLNLNYRIRELMMMTKLLTIFDDYELEFEAINSFSTSSENIENRQSAIVTGRLDKILTTGI